MKRQAVVNAGVRFHFRNQGEDGSFAETEFVYENGIADYDGRSWPEKYG